MSKVIDLFLEYVKIDTQSDEACTTSPSTAKQHVLAELLASQLTDMGAEDVVYDKEHCYVYATIPAYSIAVYARTNPTTKAKGA